MDSIKVKTKTKLTKTKFQPFSARPQFDTRRIKMKN